MENQVVVNPEFLNSWKEIASHMGRGVRTVQRWEAYGLPVRRVNGNRGAVIAIRSEIDAWFATREAAKAPKNAIELPKRDGSRKRWRCFSS